MKSYLPKMAKFRGQPTQVATPTGLSKKDSLSTETPTLRLRKMAAKKTRTRKKRSASRRVKRVKRALGRKANGQFVRRAKHRVRSHNRKVPGRAKKKRVRSHLSYETVAKKKNPRRRARRVAKEEPMKRKRRRSGTKKRRAHAAEAAPIRRRRRKAKVSSTRKRRRRNPVAAVGERRRPRRRAKRRTAKRHCGKYKRVAGKRKCARYSPPKRRRAKRRSSRRKGAYSRIARRPTGTGSTSISSEYAMENPMSGGELIFASVTGILGYGAVDYLDRWLANRELATTGSTSLASGASPLSPAMAALTKPGIMRILAQAGAAAAPLAAAHFVNEPMGRAALQGFGFGAIIHLGSQLLTHFVVEKIVGQSAAGTFGGNVNSLYAAEMIADNNSDLVTTGTAGTLTPINNASNATAKNVVSGIPGMLGKSALRVSNAFYAPRALNAPAKTLAGCGGGGDCGSNTMEDGGGCGDQSSAQFPAIPPAVFNPTVYADGRNRRGDGNGGNGGNGNGGSNGGGGGGYSVPCPPCVAAAPCPPAAPAPVISPIPPPVRVPSQLGHVPNHGFEFGNRGLAAYSASE